MVPGRTTSDRLAAAVVFVVLFVLLGLAVALSPAPGLATVGLVGPAVLLVLWALSRPKEGG
jgi:hypothetical protein